MVYEEQHTCENSIKKYSDYYSYYYGDSLLFTRENIHFMKRFYMNYPFFYKKMNSISWRQYQLLLMITNKKERMFYYSLLLFVSISYFEFVNLLEEQLYYRI